MMNLSHHFPINAGENTASAIKELGKCISTAKTLSKRLDKSASDPQKHLVQIVRCKKSRAFLIAARFRANKRLPIARRETAPEILTRPDLAFWKKLPDETVSVRLKPKKNGKFRTICRFGPDTSMMLEASRMLLAADFGPKAWQWDYGNSPGSGGLHNAIQHACEKIGAGWCYAARADISEFYASFDVKECEKAFPKHKKVIALYLSGDHMTVECKSPRGLPLSTISKEARRGGLIGSPLSALMGGLIISHLDWDQPVEMINYVDDFLVLGKTKDSVDCGLNALKSKISALPGGHFELHCGPVVSVTDGVQYLGHDLSSNESGPHVRCAYKSWERMYGELHERLPDLTQLKLGQTDELVKRLGSAWLYAKSWGIAFKLCEDIDEHLAVAEAGIKSAAKNAAIPWPLVLAHQDMSQALTHPYGY